MDKVYTAILIFVLMVLSLSLRLTPADNRMDHICHAPAELHFVLDDGEIHSLPPMTECNFVSSSIFKLQAPTKKIFFRDLFSALFSLESVSESGCNENSYYSVVSKFPQIYIVSDRNQRAPPVFLPAESFC